MACATWAEPFDAEINPHVSGRMTARDPTALLLSRIQFGFTISFHIIFLHSPSALPRGSSFLRRCICEPAGRCTQALFEFWLKIFGVAFGLGVR
jgi:cytochrome d ubiquinol oxidase subunit I